MPPLPSPRSRGRPPKPLRDVARVAPSNSPQPPRHPQESVVSIPPAVLPPPNHRPPPAPTPNCHPIYARRVQRLLSKRAERPLEASAGICVLRATRLLRSCCPFVGHSPISRKNRPEPGIIPHTPSLRPLPILSESRPESGI